MSSASAISRPRWPARSTSPEGTSAVGGASSVAHDDCDVCAETIGITRSRKLTTTNPRAAFLNVCDTGGPFYLNRNFQFGLLVRAHHTLPVVSSQRVWR